MEMSAARFVGSQRRLGIRIMQKRNLSDSDDPGEDNPLICGLEHGRGGWEMKEMVTLGCMHDRPPIAAGSQSYDLPSLTLEDEADARH